MWRTQKNLDGRRLTKFEFGCLVERWTEIFGKCRKLMAIRQAMMFEATQKIITLILVFFMGVSIRP